MGVRDAVIAVILAAVLGAPGTASTGSANGRLVFTQILGYQQSRFSAPIGYLCAADPGGGAQSRVTPAGYPHPLEAASSPDGTRLAYVRGVSAGGDLHVAASDGSGDTGIAPGVFASRPAWTPDGRRIVFATRLAGTTSESRLMSVRSDGADLRELTSGRLDLTPTISPDGTRVVFASDRATRDPRSLDLFSLDLASGAVTPLTLTPDVTESEPDFAPDGRELVFVAAPVSSPAASHLEVVGASGIQRARLTAGTDDRYPRVSPDGNLVAFVRGGDVWTIGRDGSGERHVTSSPLAELDPAWQPAGPAPAGGQGTCAIVGTSGDDVLTGSDERDFFYDAGGNDVIYGGGGDDVIYDGDGDDVIRGADGRDTIVLGAGRNIAFGQGDSDLLSVAGGVEGGQVLDGGDAGDTLNGGRGNDVLRGGGGDDNLVGARGRDVERGGMGDDTLRGGRDGDVLYGDEGADTLWGDSSVGETYRGDDALYGGNGRDVLRAGRGNDRLYAAGDHARDYVDGGPGRDGATWDRALDAVIDIESRLR